jgi:transposase
MSLLLTDDTPVPVLAKTKTRLGRLWTYVRDDRPFAGPAPAAAAFLYSPDRGGQHPQRHLAGWSGLMQADAYAGYAELYEMARKPALIVELPCWSHARRKFYELATRCGSKLDCRSRGTLSSILPVPVSTVLLL